MKSCFFILNEKVKYLVKVTKNDWFSFSQPLKNLCKLFPFSNLAIKIKYLISLVISQNVWPMKMNINS